MVVGQLGKPVVDAHQGVGIVVRLVEPHGRSRGAQRIVEDLPDFPRLQLCDVLVGRQPLKVDLDLRSRSDRHVVDQSPCSCVADVLQVLDDLRDALTPKGSRLLDERRLGVGLFPQRIVVQHSFDDVVPHDPDVGVVLTSLVRDFLVGHAPLAEHLAADLAPEPQRVVDLRGTKLSVELALLFLTGILLPLLHPRLGVADL